MNLGRRSSLFAFVVCFAFGTTVAMASAVTTYDTNAPFPGWVNGTGGVNGDFTDLVADYGDGVTATLFGRAEWRYNAPIQPAIDNVYNSPAPGAQIDADLGLIVTGSFLDQYNTTWTFDDTTTGESITYNPLTALPDNTYINADGTTSTTLTATTVGFENAEYLGFYSSLIGYQAGHQVLVTENVYPLSDQSADPSNPIIINTAAALAPTPEPSSIAVIGLGGLAIAFTARRRRKQAVQNQ
jgi:PEP-CTERM motif